MNTTCPNCCHTFPVTIGPRRERELLPPMAIASGAGAGAGCAAAEQADGYSEPAGTKLQRGVADIRRDLLQAHKEHIAASELEEHARKAHQAASHNTVDKLGAVTRLRNELVHHVERPDAKELFG